jgi:hypothetical protein
LAAPLALLLCGAGGWWGFDALFAEHDPLPACRPLPAPAADAGDGVRAGAERPFFTAPVTAGPLVAAALLTDDRPNSTGYVLAADRRSYRLPGDEPVSAVVADPTGARVAVLPDVAIAPTDHPTPVLGKRIGLYDIARGRLSWTPIPDDARAAAFSPDGTRLAVLLGRPGPVAPAPRVLLMDVPVGGQRLITPTLDGRPLEGFLTAVNWQPGADRLLLSTNGATTAHGPDGAGRVTARAGLIPQGVSPDGRRGVASDGTVVDLATGAARRSPVLDPCQDHGIDRGFEAVGWYDDTQLLAVQTDIGWPMDQRRGEPRRGPAGMRLVVMDPDGRVGRVVVGWSPDIPRLSFIRPVSRS